MAIKKELRMIRLCNLLYEMTLQFTSRYSLYENPMEILQGMLCKKALNSM